MLHLHRMRKERVFLLVQVSCACFMLSLLGGLGSIILLAAKKSPGPRWKLLGHVGLWGAVAAAALGVLLAVMSLLAMRRRHFPQQDRHLCRIALILDCIAALAFAAHPLWLTWMGK